MRLSPPTAARRKAQPAIPRLTVYSGPARRYRQDLRGTAFAKKRRVILRLQLGETVAIVGGAAMPGGDDPGLHLP